MHTRQINNPQCLWFTVTVMHCVLFNMLQSLFKKNTFHKQKLLLTLFSARTYNVHVLTKRPKKKLLLVFVIGRDITFLHLVNDLGNVSFTLYNNQYQSLTTDRVNAC